MSQGWEASTEAGVFTDWSALGTGEELLPQYDEGFMPDLDDSWLSAFIDNEVLPDPSNDSLRQFDADVDSTDKGAGCNVGVDLMTSTFHKPADPYGPSFNQFDCVLDFLNDGIPEQVGIVTTNEEEAKIEPTNHSCPSPTAKTLPTPSRQLSSTRPCQQRSAKLPASDKPKSTRTKISNEARSMLDAHFDGNPYPTDGELALLSGKTALPVLVIKRWFMNARSRKTMPEDNVDTKLNVKAQEDHEQIDQSLLSGAASCHGSLQDLERCSPAPSAASLERYLNEPADQDSVPAGVIESALQDNLPVMPPINEQLFAPRQSKMTKIACSRCRLRKSRCNYEAPACARCQKDGVICIYDEPLKSTRRHSSIKFPTPLSRSRQQSPMRAFSIAGSDSSAGSHISMRSSGSHISVDSRGSRRGRKRWARPLTPPETHSAKRQRTAIPESFPPLFDTNMAELSDDCIEMSKDWRDEIDDFSKFFRTKRLNYRPYFCTWPACSNTFANRSAWTRHEEAVHHCPYQWICSMDVNTVMRLPHCFGCGERDVLLSHVVECHFQTCASKPEECRTFLREDQLSQHIKGVHIDKRSEKISIPKELLSAWKRDNPLLSKAALTCGFCGIVSGTWVERQDHVSEHMVRNISKSSWWPERLPTVLSQLASTGPFTCPGCSSQFSDITVAASEHRRCITWSCRYLYDWHALFSVTTEGRLERNLWYLAKCRLCKFKLPEFDLGNPSITYLLQQHADLHQLRTCDQEIHANHDDFRRHLETDHGAVSFDTSAWRCVRSLRKTRDKYVARTFFKSIERILCSTRYIRIHQVFSDTIS